MDSWNKTSSAWSTITKVPDFKENIAYDPNGNILKYKRAGNNTFASQPIGMDSLGYSYIAGTNRLDHISDSVPSGNYTTDIDGQSSGNYKYDSIGQLISDDAAGISNISWTVYGKIASITKGGDTTIYYTYDPGGNRISKSLVHFTDTTTTWYVRDAQGNVLSVYTYGDPAVHGRELTQTELHLYGSSRLGILRMNRDVSAAPVDTVLFPPFDGIANNITFTRGKKLFELTNHLGNVLATVSDKRFGVVAAPADTTVAYFIPDLVSANDYYPFGSVEPGRSYAKSGAGYRYGFNGKENDNEVKGVGDQIDYGMRVYDPRVGKFLSTDPLARQFPFYSPYQYAGNKPIWATDLDGAEELIFPRMFFPRPILTLPKLPSIPVQPLPPIPPAIPTGMSLPQTPTLPPGPFIPLPPPTPSITRSIPIDESNINPNDATTYPAPPFEGEWKVTPLKPGTKGYEKLKDKGATRLENDEGDILRWHQADKQHPKSHWDLKRGGSANNPWENYTPEGIKIPDGSIYGKDFNPAMYNPFSNDDLMKRLRQFSDDQEYQQKSKQYEKNMKKYEKEKNEYDKQRQERNRSSVPEQIIA